MGSMFIVFAESFTATELTELAFAVPLLTEGVVTLTSSVGECVVG